MLTVKKLIAALSNIENKEQSIWASIVTEDDIKETATEDCDKTLSNEQAKSVIEQMNNTDLLDDNLTDFIFDAIRRASEVTP